jgi:hypothetical protein
MRAKVKKFGVSLTYHNTYIRYVGEDNDLQEQFYYGGDFTEDGTEVQEKKLKIIYKALKEGQIKLSFNRKLIKCKYVLPNKFRAKYEKESGQMIVLLGMFGFQLYDNKNNYLDPTSDDNNVRLAYHQAYSSISDRFQRSFGVIFQYPAGSSYADLQEQFDDNNDGEEDYIYVDNGTPSQEKKIKVLYKAFKEGYIKMRFDGELYKFRYVLPNKFGAKYSKVSDSMTLIVPKFSIKLYGTNNQLIYPNDPVTKQLHLTAYRLVSRRFQINFGVIFEEPPVGYDNYQTINGDLQEEVSINQLTDKDLKKAKAIYTFLKTGFVNYKSVAFLQKENYKIRYYLQDNYSIKKDSSGKLTIYFTENIYNVVKLFAEKEDGTKTLIEPRSNLWFATEFAVTNKIVNKFRQFDINIKIS